MCRYHAICLPTLLPLMDPAIHYAKPRWIARVPRIRGTIEVEASTVAEARFAAARRFACSVAIVTVQPAYDPAVSRFGWRA